MKYFVRSLFQRNIGNTNETVHRIVISPRKADDFGDAPISEYPHKETLNHVFYSFKPGKNYDETYLPDVDPMTLDINIIDELLARGHYEVEVTVHPKAHPSVIIPLFDEITGEKQANIMLIFDTDAVESIFCPNAWLRYDASERACSNLFMFEPNTKLFSRYVLESNQSIDG